MARIGIAGIALLGLTVACGASKVEVDAATSDQVAEVSQDSRTREELREPVDVEAAKCSSLDQEACEASGACMAIEGWAKPQACLVWNDRPGAGDEQFVSCTSTRECGMGFTWARSEDKPDEVWLFPNTCIPGGWVEVEEPPCGPGCPEVHPWLTEPQTWKCDLPDGTVCSWSAEGCAPGQKPDNF